MRYFLSIAIGSLISLCISASISSAAKTPALTIEHYFDALLTGDYAAAESCWDPQIIGTSRRLGITYHGVDIKWDCASPVVQHLESIRQGLLAYHIHEPGPENPDVIVPVTFTTQSDTLIYQYHVSRIYDDWKLTSPLFLETDSWKVASSRFFRIHYQDESQINSYAIEELDRFAADLLGLFDVPAAKKSRLEEARIDYYLTDDTDIKCLTGYECHGLANLQLDAIVSRHLPHYHEIVHLLINFALDDPALYTLPFLQEGLAVCLGGRWERSPAVLKQMGQFILSNGFIQIEDLLSWPDFHHCGGGADLAYPVSGLFVGFLLDRLNAADFKALYRALSGSAPEVQALQKTAIINLVEQSTSASWDELLVEFQKYSAQFSGSGIEPGIDIPAEHRPTIRIEEDIKVNIWETDEYYHFEIAADSSDPSGVILLKAKNDSELPYISAKFTEQLPDADYHNETFGIQFNPQEAGLYDYRTDTLIMKYVLSFSPHPEYYQPEKRSLYFRISKSEFPQNLMEMQVSFEQD